MLALPTRAPAGRGWAVLAAAFLRAGPASQISDLDVASGRTRDSADKEVRSVGTRPQRAVPRP